MVIQLEETPKQPLDHYVNLLAFDSFTAGDTPPRPPELGAVFLLGRITILYMGDFVEATRKTKRAVKYKTMTLVFDKTKLSEEEVSILRAFAGFGVNEFYDDNSIVALTIRFERGLALHTLHHLLTFRELLIPHPISKRNILNELFEKAGVYVDILLSEIDSDFIHQLVADLIETLYRSYPDLLVSAYIDKRHVHLRLSAETRYYRYEREQFLDTYDENGEYHTLEDLMEMKDWRYKCLKVVGNIKIAHQGELPVKIDF